MGVHYRAKAKHPKGLSPPKIFGGKSFAGKFRSKCRINICSTQSPGKISINAERSYKTVSLPPINATLGS